MSTSRARAQRTIRKPSRVAKAWRRILHQWAPCYFAGAATCWIITSSPIAVSPGVIALPALGAWLYVERPWSRFLQAMRGSSSSVRRTRSTPVPRQSTRQRSTPPRQSPQVRRPQPPYRVPPTRTGPDRNVLAFKASPRRSSIEQPAVLSQLLREFSDLLDSQHTREGDHEQD